MFPLSKSVIHRNLYPIFVDPTRTICHLVSTITIATFVTFDGKVTITNLDFFEVLTRSFVSALSGRIVVEGLMQNYCFVYRVYLVLNGLRPRNVSASVTIVTSLTCSVGFGLACTCFV